jgi:hypothetical protein
MHSLYHSSPRLCVWGASSVAGSHRGTDWNVLSPGTQAQKSSVVLTSLLLAANRQRKFFSSARLCEE